MKKFKQVNASELEDGTVDRISSLPDPILHLILSHLRNTEEAIRTSIFSRRWRYLWTSVHSLHIHDYRSLINPLIEFNKNKFEEFVYQVLGINSLDLNNVSFSCMHPYNMSTVGRWIDAIVRRKVKLLDLSFCVDDKNDDFKLPHSLVTSGSLEVLKFSLNGDCLSFPNFTGLSALRVLELEGCKFLNYDLVHNFLNSLTLLEDLSLIGCETHDFLNFSMSCPNLKNLRIDSRESVDMVYELCYHLEICCPNFVFLEIVGFMSKEIILESLDSLKKVVIHPEETFEWSGKVVCDLFTGFFHVEYLSLHIGVIEEEFYFENPPKSLPNLKTLELITTIEDPDYLDVLIRILTCSPILESFHLILEKPLFSHYLDESPDFDILKMQCTFEQLKIIKVKGLCYYPEDIRVIEFLLQSTPALETISITPRVDMNNELFKSLVESVELLGFRASIKPEIIFVQNHV